LARHKRYLLGTEAIYQLVGTAMLVCYAVSQTRTSQSLVGLFEENSFIGLPVPTKVAVTLSLVWSLCSFTVAHIIGIGGHRDYFPYSSRMILACAVLIASLVRVMTITLYFTPTLGLFNLLRHFQGNKTIL
jgi:phosphatidylserine synthase